MGSPGSAGTDAFSSISFDGGLRCSYAVVALRRVADLRFEMDEIENATDKKKHGAAFEESQSVSHVERALLSEDPDDSHGEDRFLRLRLSGALRTLLVCRCHRRRDPVIRIISVRRTDSTERAAYERRSLAMLRRWFRLPPTGWPGNSPAMV
jgi:uncharacterized DUF497 family protein